MPPTPSTGVGTVGGSNWEKPAAVDRVTQRPGAVVLIDGCQVLVLSSRLQVVYRDLQRPSPAVPREAVLTALDSWYKPRCSPVR